MDWLMWVVLAALFTGTLPILVGGVIYLLAAIVEHAMDKRERKQTRGAKR